MNYPTQQSAQGLASLGRGNDSMLMHVTPREVAGLQSLAMARGGSLTINPQTGLPEAGFLDSIFNIALPVAGGFFGLDPFLVAGIMGGKSLVEGGDPLEAAMGAFSGYSGAKMGINLKDFTTPLKVPTALTNTFDDAVTNLDKIDTSKLMQAEGGIKPATFPDTTPYNRLEVPNFNVGNAGYNVPASGVQGKLDLGIPSNLKDATVPPSAGIKDIGYNSFSSTPAVQVPNAVNAIEPVSPISAVAKDPVGFARQVGDGSALTGAAKIGMYGFSPFVGDILKPEEYAGYEDPEKGKWTSESGGLSFNPKYSTNLRLGPNLNQPIRAAEGGAISSYAVGGTVTTGGLRDLYGTADNNTNPQLSRDGYGVGRLENLARQQAMTQAQTTGYARGGYLDGAGDGMSDSIPATIEGKQPARLADGEFVIPADVVSHLGNGSSKAGSKRLYAMLDKVRHARTGNKKQGKEIKAEKYLPKVA
jgi:hypothetical protein